MPEPEAAAGGPWPANARFGPVGLSVGGVLAEDLAARYRTPLLVADEEHIRNRCRAFARLFPHPLYAVKAFTSRAMIQLVAEEGLNLLVATGGELHACLSAGIPGERIAFHGNNKSDDELRLAASSGVWLVNVDNPAELERLDPIARAAGVVQSVLLRVIPGVRAGAHEAIRTGTAGTKFGMPLTMVGGAVRRAMELSNVHPAGIHAHIGSQVLEPEPYLAAVDVVLDLLERLKRDTGFEADVVDVGGGFGVSYTDERPLELDRLAPALLARVRDGASRRGLRIPHTLVEPGRSVVGSAMVTLYRVGAVKETPEGRNLVAVDGGMADNIRPMLYGARYTVAMAGPPRDAGPVEIDVVGRHCESGDMLAREVKLSQDVRPGDLVAFAGTGAYTYSMAGNYNRVGRPAVVAVRDGRSRVWLRREDDADLDRLEASAPSFRSPPLPAKSFEVRPARPGDARSFLEAFRSVAAERRFIQTEEVSQTARHYRKRFRRPVTREGANLVAVAGGGIIGSISIQRDAHPAIRHTASIGMFVTSAWRGRGVGTALMDGAMRWARDAGVERVDLSVYPHNQAAIGLYRAFGFVEEGRLIRHAKKSYGYEDEILMAVWLGPRSTTGDRGGEPEG
ncbi:MAG TPA: diaminopimelate decarboxylase [Actinomycetota bacterium]|nr:diaminopimelate decarboxylase [Actinomycetota bacterium]